MVLALLSPRVRHLAFLHGYGIAEVDSSLMMSRTRDAAGRGHEASWQCLAARGNAEVKS